MKKFILVLNAGSATVKFKLFNDKLKTVASGIVERIGLAGSFIIVQQCGKENKLFQPVKDHSAAVRLILDEMQGLASQIKVVGHRVVHGGERFVKPILVTPAILKELGKYNHLAPLHNPHNLAGIKACLELLPRAKQYAAFDTAFHATLPDYAYLYPLPLKFYKQYGIRRYGFHGLSHQYVSQEAAKRLKIKKPNLITCHLGSGCSITAISKGKSIDTSMGFTPLEGLMMGTRSGDIDPAIIFFLKEEGLSLDSIQKQLNEESGLKGVCGLRDMRDIMLANGYNIPGYTASIRFSEEQKSLARLALKMFVYRLQKYIGAYAIVLKKTDAIVFTAGIGERNQVVRRLALKGLPFKFRPLVIKTDEELMIARLIK